MLSFVQVAIAIPITVYSYITIATCTAIQNAVIATCMIIATYLLHVIMYSN